jgi:diguanylate cyclase (GGDEF)-like protein/PAS domain S-box-containing protein
MIFEPLFNQLIESTNDIVLLCDTTPFEEGGPRIVYVNPAFEEVMGYKAEEVIGQSPRILNGSSTDRQSRYRIRKALRQGKPVRTELMKYSKDGRGVWMDVNILPLRDEAGHIKCFASIERDLTRYKKMERQLAQMALFDDLTGSLSRAAFYQQAEKEFTRARRYHRPLSTLMIDIDHFKRVNDAYGHAAGDHVLMIFAEAVQEIIRSTDFIGRVGGEEFAILMPDTTLTAACHLAERIRERVNKYPYQAKDRLIEITASLGVAELQATDQDFKALLKRADEALYSAKQAGRNRVMQAA